MSVKVWKLIHHLTNGKMVIIGPKQQLNLLVLTLLVMVLQGYPQPRLAIGVVMSKVSCSIVRLMLYR